MINFDHLSHLSTGFGVFLHDAQAVQRTTNEKTKPVRNAMKQHTMAQTQKP